MYTDRPETRINEEKAIELAGKEAVEAVKAENCDFTGRVIDDCFGVAEMSASVELENGDTLVIYYLIDKTEIDESDGDLGNLDYSNYSFEII